MGERKGRGRCVLSLYLLTLSLSVYVVCGSSVATLSRTVVLEHLSTVDRVDSVWYGTPRSSRPPSLHTGVFIGGGHNKHGAGSMLSFLFRVNFFPCLIPASFPRAPSSFLGRPYSCPTTPTNKEHKISLSHKERTLSVWAKKKDYSMGGHLLLFHLQQKCF